MSRFGRATIRSPRGLTLVEILAAMGVLAIGLSACIGLVIGTTRAATAASDRNIASLLLPEAIAAIEKNHLITEVMPNGIVPQSLHVGLLIETLKGPNPNTHDLPYSGLHINALPFSHASRMPPPYLPPPTATESTAIFHTALWPNGLEPAYYAGPLRETGANQDPTGNAFRVVYQLERHPEWHPHKAEYRTVPEYYAEESNSPFRGVYVLTLVVYRDPKRDASRLEQISEPFVVHLRDKKVRP